MADNEFLLCERLTSGDGCRERATETKVSTAQANAMMPKRIHVLWHPPIHHVYMMPPPASPERESVLATVNIFKCEGADLG
jgi:hypothetical protein